VLEGCAGPGTRRLLQFTTETRNIGNGDLTFGNPATNALFHFASCHGHYHFEDFAIYDLLDGNGNSVASGHKVGFCLVDQHPFTDTANPQQKYDCNNQGIQPGWADVYAFDLPCQYIDITGLPSGDYVLRMEVNHMRLFMESNTDNNVILVAVSIPGANCLDTPANDNFSTPVVLAGMSSSLSQFNQCATKQAGEPNHAGSTGGHSLWYSWTPTVTHNALITTKRSDFNTVLAIYTGSSVSGLTLIGSNDDISGSYNPQSEVFFQALAGTTYRIAVDGFEAAIGNTVINVNPPGNDDFDEPYVLLGTGGSTNGTTVGASKHVYEPAHTSDVGGHSVWYTWTAPVNGPVEFNTVGSAFNTTLAVYTGNHLYNNTLVAENDNAGAGVFTSTVRFIAEAGRTYEIALDGSGDDNGTFVLSWNMHSYLEIMSANNGFAEIRVTGVIWQRYLLLSSTNLTDWVTFKGPFTMLNTPYVATNSLAPSKQFFRSMMLP